MTRGSKLFVVALVVIAAMAGGVGNVAAADAGGSTTATTTAAQSDCSFPVTRTDATGTDVTLDESPEDVVVLGSSTAQTVWELGEQEHVVGMPVAQSTAYLNGSTERPHVLDGIRVQIETVVDLEPDLVIAPDTIQSEDVQALRDAGLTVFRENDGSSFQDVRNRTEATGRLLGACGAANDTITWMNERLSVVEEAVAGVDRPTVFAGVTSGYTPGSDTFQGDLIARGGGENAAANMGIQGWDTYEVEAAIAENPDYFLVTGSATVPEDSQLQQTTAGQENNVVRVNSNYWNQPAPRVVLAVENITRQLHPAAYENATSPPAENGSDAGGDADDADAGGADDSGGDDDSDDSMGDDGSNNGSDGSSDGGSGDGSPGFGVPVTVVALLGAVFALRRRA